MILLFLVLAAILLTILIFSSKRFSPIPYFPTNRKDLPIVIEALNLKNNQTVFDLGAGDGGVIFEAAKKAFQKKLNTKFIAVEINPVLLLVLQIRRFLHPNRNNIKIIYGDMFSMKFKSILDTVFYLYISPWLLQKTISNIKKQFSKFHLVSYMYRVKPLGNQEKIIKGLKHDIYAYSI